MDFTFTEEQDAAADLARRLCADREPGPSAGTDHELLREVTNAGLLSLHLPEPIGTAVGMVAACRALAELGRVAAPIPAAGLVAATATLLSAPHWLGHLDGELVLPALGEGSDAAPDDPGTTARPTDDGWVLTGTKTMIAHGEAAGWFVLTAVDQAEAAVFLVSVDDPGVVRTVDEASGGLPVATLELTGVLVGADRRLGGADLAVRLRRALTLTTAAVQYGVSERALELTAAYTAERKQFDRPLGAFQAVTQRLGDAYIDVACQRLSLWQAAWRWEADEPLGDAVEIAGFWAAEGGNRVAHSAIHLHGGAGVDLDGVVHHFFTATKRLEFTVGGANRQALAIGRELARGSSTQPGSERVSNWQGK